MILGFDPFSVKLSFRLFMVQLSEEMLVFISRFE